MLNANVLRKNTNSHFLTEADVLKDEADVSENGKRFLGLKFVDRKTVGWELLDMNYAGLVAMLLTAVVSTGFYHRRNIEAAVHKNRSENTLQVFEPVYIFIQFSTLVSGLASCTSDSALLLKWDLSPSWHLAGWVLLSSSLTAFGWSMTSLGTCYSPCYCMTRPSEVVKEGPYRWVRHPIYTCNLGVMLSLFLITETAWIFFNFVLLLPILRGGHKDRREPAQIALSGL